MADVTELRCWPSCVDAIDWSQDGIIALASDERVELLFPNTVTFDRDNDVAQWRHVALQVPWFSNEEMPVKEPGPVISFSVGEEVSASPPISIAWSPPGLAKHRRCALGVLTASLLLSIWSADGRPFEESSWSRKLIVNNALAEYFLKNAPDEPSHVTSGVEEQIRFKTRIRAFVWAPALPSSESVGIIGTSLSYGQHIVAVSNDDNQLVFVVIGSPTSTLGSEQSWNAKVLTHFSITPDPESVFSEPTFFDDLMKQQTHVSHIAWSPWIIRGGRYHSVIVYATNEDVRARTITYAYNSITLGDEVLYPEIELRNYGPMKWAPQTRDGDKFTLAVFSNTGLVCLTVSANDASILDRITHNLDGRWDTTSGAVWDFDQYSTPRLHISSLLSTLHCSTAVLEFSSEGPTPLKSPNWRDQIENNLVLFSVKNDLKGNSKAKVWGLTVSPLGDFIAACNSVHPSDMIEYGPPADRRGTVAISTLRQYTQIRRAFPSKNVGAEGILFTLKKLVDNTVEDTDQMPAFVEEMVEKLMQAYAPLQDPREPISTSASVHKSSDLHELVTRLKTAAFLDPHTLKDRYTILASRACNITDSVDLSKTLIMYRLACASQSLLSTLSQTPFSAEILAQHRQVLSLIHALTDPDTTEADVEDAEDGPNSTSLDSTITAAGIDTCDFCSAPIPFTDLTTAACTNGHQFPRCQLTFLAIQAPGITKYCGLCATPYLSDEFVAAQEAQGGEGIVDQDGIMQDLDDTAEGPEGRPLQQERTQEEDTEMANGDGNTTMSPSTEDERSEPPITLARVLFLACDACIYCGGKFVG
ncbi:hypothetical protein P153DRAFT_279490 [Dothidotthia symphoricarpi CBS 119687]|uniref:Transcription factor IIIC putative zinc-finger domain-containing protein n=1 Tax=Dothidotthia symphoricarpi CBS 119687 TaxID=1392245 RepID=A0A6A6AVF1_9PLEO|nr:uncharacterized protein P153DRAFT_279490 [Dothidotthia symphoricarpi CBS 119687]KAF2134511.1 hypothetical protein P153DRAFT_279490 [Dothidotthia symphoricarpi CBS 119687]